MCLAVPMKLVKRNGEMGVVELGGVEREISLMLVPDAAMGEYLVVHAGFAIQKLDEADARETLDILMQMNPGISNELSLNPPASETDQE